MIGRELGRWQRSTRRVPPDPARPLKMASVNNDDIGKKSGDHFAFQSRKWNRRRQLAAARKLRKQVASDDDVTENVRDLLPSPDLTARSQVDDSDSVVDAMEPSHSEIKIGALKNADDNKVPGNGMSAIVNSRQFKIFGCFKASIYGIYGCILMETYYLETCHNVPEPVQCWLNCDCTCPILADLYVYMGSYAAWILDVSYPCNPNIKMPYGLLGNGVIFDKPFLWRKIMMDLLGKQIWMYSVSCKMPQIARINPFFSFYQTG